MNKANICQVAFVTERAKALRDWYCDTFGFIPAGRTIFAGSLATRVQGIEKDFNYCYWAIDGKRQFQLEFFNFVSPGVESKPVGWNIDSPGFNIVGIYSWAFNQILEKLAGQGINYQLVDYEGDLRAATFLDPESNRIELYEQDPFGEGALARNDIPSTVRYVRLMVTDLEQTTSLWQNAFKLVNVADEQASFTSISPLASEQSKTLVSESMLLELVKTTEKWPAPEPQAINQQGLMNIAVGADSVAQWDQVYADALYQGCKNNGKPLDALIFKVMYVMDRLGHSVEILYPRTAFYSVTGFVASGIDASSSIEIDAPTADVWQAITDNHTAAEWAFFDVKKVTPSPEGTFTGECRKISLFGLPFEETVTYTEDEKYYEYRILNSWLVPGHKGILRVQQAGAKTRLTWQISISLPIPLVNTIGSWLMTKLIKGSLEKLRDRLEK